MGNDLGREPCKVTGCRRRSHAHGLCHAHDVATRAGLEPSGPVRKIRRLTDQEALEIRRRYVSRSRPTVLELAQEYRTSRITVWRALRGERHAVSDGLDDRIRQRMADNMHPHARRDV